jgi:hypothetical protein
MKKKTEKKSLSPAFSHQIGIKELILLGIYFVLERDKHCSFPKLVKECFNSFPEQFALDGCFQWPDSRKLDRPLRVLRKRKLISGDPASFFQLTKAGRKSAEEIAQMFRQRELF